MRSEESSKRKSPKFREDIQALRALAVVGVLVFHLRSSWLSGGYVGVDVFFVISGFLITAHLLRELDGTGSISLRRFYARRIRRLLPAAISVLVFAFVATIVWLPDSLVSQNLRSIVAATFYFENWALAAESVDYLRAGAESTLVRHFWTLSLEEQFYFFWPMLLIALAFIARKRRLRDARVLWFGVVAVAVASFALSVVLTATSPEVAYFVTPTRVWEFAVGAGVAMGGGALSRLMGPRRRDALLWAGLVAIVGSMVLFDAETPFPGALALVPVLGTAAVIFASGGTESWSAMRIGRWRAVQHLGAVSYSLYLWHWPLVVLVPLWLGRAPSGGELAVIGLVSLVLATLSKRYIEDPFLRRGASSFLQRRSIPLVFASMVTVAALCLVTQAGIQSGVGSSASQRQEVESSACFGASSFVNPECESPTEVPPDIDTAFAAEDYADTTLEDCGKGEFVATIADSRECSFGDKSGSKTVLVIGDSHAGHWLPAIQTIGRGQGWHIVSLLRSSCPFSASTATFSGMFDQQCADWKNAAMKRAHEVAPDIVFVASLAPYGYELLDFDLGEESDLVSGFQQNLIELDTLAGQVVVMRDTPYMEANVPDCLGLSRAGGADCEAERESVLGSHFDPLWSAAGQTSGVLGVDLTDSLCDEQTCYPVVGGVVVYRDRHHFSATYARSLAPLLLDRLNAHGVALS